MEEYTGEQADVWELYITPEDGRVPCHDDQAIGSQRHETARYYGLDEESDIYLQQSRKVWQIVRAKNEEGLQTKWGHTFQVDIPSCPGRFYVAHVPSCIQHDLFATAGILDPVPVVIFFHGLNSCAWWCALKGTHWRKLAEQKRFVVIFGNGNGSYFADGPMRDRLGAVNWGDIYWEIQHPCGDFEYVDTLLHHLGVGVDDGGRSGRSESWGHGYDRITIDPQRICFVGFSNGAMFSSNVAIKYGGSVFAGICNVMGGWAGGYSEEGLMDVRDARHPVKLLVVTGTEDAYLESCLRAKDLFESVGFPVTLRILEDTAHRYVKEMERDIYHFLFDS